MGDRTAPQTLPLDPPVVVIVSPLQWRNQGRGPGGPGPPLIVRPNRGPRGRKIFLGYRAFPYLRVWMTGPLPYLRVWMTGPLPYLKVWISATALLSKSLRFCFLCKLKLLLFKLSGIT